MKGGKTAKIATPLAPEPSAFAVAADIIRTYLAVARRNEDGIATDIDTEFLHRYRVSLRRIRTVLSLFRDVFSESETTRLKEAFSAIMRPTGRLRDLDVYLLEKNNFYKMIPRPLHKGLDVMFDQFEEERDREMTRLSRKLRSAEYEETLRDLTARFDEPSSLEGGPNAEAGAYEFACRLIWKRYGKICRLARNITADTPDEVVHALRIHCKKLRYLMEFFGPLFDDKASKKLIKPLKKLQDNLGRFNDLSVQQQALLDFVDQHTARSGQVDVQLGMAVGGLIAVLNQRQQDVRDRVVKSFEHFDSPNTSGLFRTLFHTPTG